MLDSSYAYNNTGPGITNSVLILLVTRKMIPYFASSMHPISEQPPTHYCCGEYWPIYTINEGLFTDKKIRLSENYLRN